MNCFKITVNDKGNVWLVVWHSRYSRAVDRESSSHIARRSCAHDYEEFQNLTKLNTQGVMGSCLCVLARDWLFIQPPLLTCL